MFVVTTYLGRDADNAFFFIRQNVHKLSVDFGCRKKKCTTVARIANLTARNAWKKCK